MFDTMTITKTGGGLLGALLLFLLGGWAADSLYSVGGEEGGEEHARGYVIDTGEDEDAGEEMAEEVVEVPFAEIYAAASAADGEGLWRQCAACHATEAGSNGVGPYLFGVVGRAQGAAEGFNYSDALAGLGGEWTPEALSAFLENPADYAPGTAMRFRGISDVEDRANLIAYLDSLDD